MEDSKSDALKLLLKIDDAEILRVIAKTFESKAIFIETIEKAEQIYGISISS